MTTQHGSPLLTIPSWKLSADRFKLECCMGQIKYYIVFLVDNINGLHILKVVIS